VDARFLTQVAESIVPLDPEGDALDSGFLSWQIIEGFHFITFALGIAHIHSQKHLGPVLGLRAAGAGVDAQDGVADVILLEVQCLKFGLGELFFKCPNGLLELIPDIFALPDELGEDFGLVSFFLEETEKLEVFF
jgi:hypothetical protein